MSGFRDKTAWVELKGNECKALRAGYISLEDALRAFAAAAPSVCAGVVSDVFAEADVDGDGRVSGEEVASVFHGRNTPGGRAGAGWRDVR